MTSRPITDLSASVRNRLLRRAHPRSDDFQFLLARYGLERLLYRLSRSEWRDRFVLKGAMLFALWSERPHRTTRDVDLLGLGEFTVAGLVDVFRAICELEVEPDGLKYLSESVKGTRIMGEDEYHGIRITAEARLGKIRIPLQIDVGKGDAVFPAPGESDYPTLLGFPAPRLRVYSRYSVVAEKLQAMLVRGMSNSRMKDFYDLFKLAQLLEFDGLVLATSVSTTLKQRASTAPVGIPEALGEKFGQSPIATTQWRAFVTKNGLEPEAVELEDVIAALRDFLMPVLNAVVQGTELSQVWKPGVGWQGRQ